MKVDLPPVSARMDMSLTDIIKANKAKIKTQQKPKKPVGGAQGGVQKKKQPQKPMQKKKKIQQLMNIPQQAKMWKPPTQNVAPVPPGPGRLVVTNLDFSVNDTDVYTLFAEFGEITEAAIHYNHEGKSLGTAHINFKRGVDAAKGCNQYNGVKLDGRPMRIRMDKITGRGQVIANPPQKGLKRLQRGPQQNMGYGQYVKKLPNQGKGGGQKGYNMLYGAANRNIGGYENPGLNVSGKQQPGWGVGMMAGSKTMQQQLNTMKQQLQMLQNKTKQIPTQARTKNVNKKNKLKNKQPPPQPKNKNKQPPPQPKNKNKQPPPQPKKKKEKRAPPTAEELDAELDSYLNEIKMDAE